MGVMDFGQRSNKRFKKNRGMIVEFNDMLIGEGFLVEKLIFNSFKGLKV